MADINNKRLKKQWARDARVARIHAAHPDLAALDQAQNALVARLLREAVTAPGLTTELDERYKALAAQKEDLLDRYGIDPQAYTPDWDCPLCEDRGFRKNGEPCVCRADERRIRRLGEAGLPENYATMRFENFDVNLYTPESEAADKVKRLEDFAHKLAQGKPLGNVVLRADVGRGKTHLAVATASAALAEGLSVRYVRAGQFMENLRSDLYDKDGAGREMWRAKHCDLLIIDDLGRESISEFVIAQLTDLIEDRNNSCRSWMINTNLKGNEIADRYGARLSDRIFEKATFFFLESKGSIRRLKAINGVELI